MEKAVLAYDDNDDQGGKTREVEAGVETEAKSTDGRNDKGEERHA
jgi:hypothetical protein